MLDWFRHVVGNYSIDVKCSNHLCNRSVIVPAQLNDNSVVYCDECAKPSATEWVCDKGHRNIEYSKNVTGRCRVCGEVDSMLRGKPHYKWSWKLNKAVRL